MPASRSVKLNSIRSEIGLSYRIFSLRLSLFSFYSLTQALSVYIDTLLCCCCCFDSSFILYVAFVRTRNKKCIAVHNLAVASHCWSSTHTSFSSCVSATFQKQQETKEKIQRKRKHVVIVGFEGQENNCAVS